MMTARGSVRIFTDVDLPYGIEAMALMAEYITGRGFHVVIGDRTLPGSSYSSHMKIGRRLASAVFSAFVGRMVTGGFFDTQCGIKAFRGDVADALFPLVRVNRFACDVELVYLSLKHRLDIKRVPVRLQTTTTSSVQLWRDCPRGILDVCRIKFHQARGDYLSPVLDSIVAKDVEHLAQKERMLSL
jgi:hypothetical protein